MKPSDLSFIILISMLCLLPVAGADEAVVLTGATGRPVTPTETPAGLTGYFIITSTPSGAEVYFDNAYYGETPATVTVPVSGNPQHTIRVQTPGYDTWEKTYLGNPGPGESITISAALSPSASTGQIVVYSSPSGAAATLDRSATQTTPATFSNVPIGNHEVSVFLSGYQTYYTSVSVQRGQTTTVNAQLSSAMSTGALSITSTPPGAAVYVDGIYRGLTPATIGNLVPGQHTVTLSLAGYQDWMAQVNVQSGVVTSLYPTLASDPKPVYGTVSITSVPSGASVYADGVYIGETRLNSPLVFTQVKPGYHELLVSKSGYQDYSASGLVSAGQDLDLTITLAPNPQQPTTGGIAITSSPTGGDVFLDNAYRGISPLTIDSISPGMHTVLLQLSGYQDWRSQVQVTAGQTAPVSATLLPAPTPTPTRGEMSPLVGVAALGLLIMLARRKTT